MLFPNDGTKMMEDKHQRVGLIIPYTGPIVFSYPLYVAVISALLELDANHISLPMTSP